MQCRFFCDSGGGGCLRKAPACSKKHPHRQGEHNDAPIWISTNHPNLDMLVAVVSRKPVEIDSNNRDFHKVWKFTRPRVYDTDSDSEGGGRITSRGLPSLTVENLLLVRN